MATEWDHLRPIVKDKRPTGQISNIYNLVPSCGKCNQSKGNSDWSRWIVNSKAKKSPQSRGIKDLNKKIARLSAYERWGSVQALELEKFVGKNLWDQHWENLENLHEMMRKSQQLAEKIRKKIDMSINK